MQSSTPSVSINNRASSTTNIERIGHNSTVKGTVMNRDNIVPYKMIDDDDCDFSFLDTLSKVQSNRLDDQRCSIKVKPPSQTDLASTSLKETTNQARNHNKVTLDKLNDDFLNMIMKTQGSRLEDQRSSLATSKNAESKPPLISAKASQSSMKKQASTIPPDDSFFNMLHKVQSRRLDEQRSSLKFSSLAASLKNATSAVVKSVTSSEKQPLRN